MYLQFQYFQSLQNKNQVLLNEKRQLLIKNREEFARLEQDKVNASFILNFLVSTFMSYRLTQEMML